MKKSISFLSLLFGLFVCVTLFSACGGDDDKFSACGGDDDKDAPPSTNPIVGTWYIENESKGYQYYYEMTFNADNTCMWWRYRYEGDSKTLIDSKSGTYKIDGNQLSILYNGEEKPSTKTFTINGNKMTTSEAGGSTWTKK